MPFYFREQQNILYTENGTYCNLSIANMLCQQMYEVPNERAGPRFHFCQHSTDKEAENGN